MRNKKKKIEEILKGILRKLFKEKKNFFSMDNTSRWDSLNHLRLAEGDSRKLKIKLTNSEISKITDEKKNKIINKKKIKLLKIATNNENYKL